MKRAFRAVVFDLDGTLVDSMPLVFRAYAYALRPYLPEITDHELLRQMGGPPDRIIARLLAEPEQIAQALSRLNEFGATNWNLIRLFAGGLELLEHLRDAGLKIAVWTGRERRSTDLILGENGIAGKFDACICGDDLATHKPDPAGLVEALRRLGVSYEQALFVGDTEVDLLAGTTLGVATLLISHGQAVDQALGMKAWKIAKTPSEAYAFVRDTLTLM